MIARFATPGQWFSSGGQRLRTMAVLMIGLIGLIGCGDAVSHGRSAVLDSTDLIAMTDRMAASIVADPDVQAEIARKGSLKIVCQPVQNELTGEVIPRGQSEMFTGRVRVQLARQHNPAFIWLMNRDYFHYLQGKELEDLGPNPDSTNPEYALTATFNSLTKDDADRRSIYYLCTYELTRLNERTVLWSDKYEVKKLVEKGFLD